MKYFRDHEAWNKIKPWIFLATYVIALCFLLGNLASIWDVVKGVLSLFKSLFYAIVIAYVLNIPMSRIEKWFIQHSKEDSFLRKRKRGIAMSLTLVFALIIIMLLGSFILPSIVDSLVSLFKNLTGFFQNIVKNIDSILAYLHIDVRIEDSTQVDQFINMPWEKVASNVIAFLSGNAEGIVSSATSFISSFAVGFTGFMFSLYLLSGKEAFLRQMRKVSAAFLGYEKARILFQYASRVNVTFNSFISGQMVEACILWVLYYTTMRLCQFPYPELISTLIAVFSFVPVFGSMLAMTIGAIMMLSIDPIRSILFIIYYQLLSSFEDNFIYPRVVGNSVGLPGLWVLLSIFIAGDLFGVWGMVMAVPTTACLYVFFRDYVNQKLKKRHLVITEKEMIQEEQSCDKR